MVLVGGSMDQPQNIRQIFIGNLDQTRFPENSREPLGTISWESQGIPGNPRESIIPERCEQKKHSVKLVLVEITAVTNPVEFLSRLFILNISATPLYNYPTHGSGQAHAH